MSYYETVLRGYLRVFPEDYNRLAETLFRFAAESDDKLADRRNFVGHVTASAFVVAKDTHRVVVIHHKVLRRCLQPGGHVDPADTSLLATARRELFEETGIEVGALQYCGVDPSDESIPFNVWVYRAPPNRDKQEAGHCHYDFQYIFLSNSEVSLMPERSEVNAARWLDWKTFEGMDAFSAAAIRIKKIIVDS